MISKKVERIQNTKILETTTMGFTRKPWVSTWPLLRLLLVRGSWNKKPQIGTSEILGSMTLETTNESVKDSNIHWINKGAIKAPFPPQNHCYTHSILIHIYNLVLNNPSGWLTINDSQSRHYPFYSSEEHSYLLILSGSILLYMDDAILNALWVRLS